MLKKITGSILSKLFPKRWKEYAELKYWKKKKEDERTYHNDYYKKFYTDHFGLTDLFYEGEKVLDIGCGPRGSLEWADMASKRVGLDPLANEYLKLGADKHQMEYVASPSESIPFGDQYFDIVTSFNSLDHVENIEETVFEIKRVTKPDGLFLLLVEVNHEPTYCEPHMIKPGNVKELFSPEFKCLNIDVYEQTGSGLYDSLDKGYKRSNFELDSNKGWLSAKFQRS